MKIEGHHAEGDDVLLERIPRLSSLKLLGIRNCETKEEITQARLPSPNYVR